MPSRPSLPRTRMATLLLSAMKPLWRSSAGGSTTPGSALPFVDVFCEKGAFNLTQTQRILARAKMLGFPLKIHVDEFENLGVPAWLLNSAQFLQITWLRPLQQISTPSALQTPLQSPCPVRLSVWVNANFLAPNSSWLPMVFWRWRLT